jgi:uncharacterized membrane protein YhaH (DUF805 family)
MQPSIALFLIPSGRVGRQVFWLATLVLIALALAVFLVVSPAMFPEADTRVLPSLTETAVNLLAIWPFTVLSVKRFNDRDFPNWVGWIVGAMSATWTIAEHFGHFDESNWSSIALWEQVFLVLFGLIFLWSLYENGILRGTVGPNRYGLDPLAT